MIDGPDVPTAAPRPVVFVGCAVCVVALGWLRYLSGPEYSLSALYLLPVMCATWFVGRRSGLFLGVLSVLSWFAADVWMLRRFSSPAVPVINATLRLLVFLFIVVVLSKLRTTMERVRRLALTDPLTGIPNRRAFFEYGNRAVNVCQVSQVGSRQ